MLAFSIALLLDMPRPYWAMASVYITSNVLTGATSSKAVYRILGTLVGAAGTIVLSRTSPMRRNCLASHRAVGWALPVPVADRRHAAQLRPSCWPATLWRSSVFRSSQRHKRLLTSWCPASRKSTLGIICASVVATLRVSAQRGLRIAGHGGRLAHCCASTGHGCPQRSVAAIRSVTANACAWLPRPPNRPAYRASRLRAHHFRKCRARPAAPAATHAIAASAARIDRGPQACALDANKGASARMAGIYTSTARWLEGGGSRWTGSRCAARGAR